MAWLGSPFSVGGLDAKVWMAFQNCENSGSYVFGEVALSLSLVVVFALHTHRIMCEWDFYSLKFDKKSRFRGKLNWCCITW